MFILLKITIQSIWPAAIIASGHYVLVVLVSLHAAGLEPAVSYQEAGYEPGAFDHSAMHAYFLFSFGKLGFYFVKTQTLKKSSKLLCKRFCFLQSLSFYLFTFCKQNVHKTQRIPKCHTFLPEHFVVLNILLAKCTQKYIFASKAFLPAKCTPTGGIKKKTPHFTT